MAACSTTPAMEPATQCAQKGDRPSHSSQSSSKVCCCCCSELMPENESEYFVECDYWNESQCCGGAYLLLCGLVNGSLCNISSSLLRCWCVRFSLQCQSSALAVSYFNRCRQMVNAKSSKVLGSTVKLLLLWQTRRGSARSSRCSAPRVSVVAVARPFFGFGLLR